MMILCVGGGRRLVLFVVGRVEVGRHGLELGGAGVHQLEDRLDSLAFAQFPHLLRAGVAFQLPLGGNALVAEAEALEAEKFVAGNRFRRGFGNRRLGQGDFANLVEEPGVHAGEPGNLPDAHAALKA